MPALTKNGSNCLCLGFPFWQLGFTIFTSMHVLECGCLCR